MLCRGLGNIRRIDGSEELPCRRGGVFLFGGDSYPDRVTTEPEKRGSGRYGEINDFQSHRSPTGIVSAWCFFKPIKCGSGGEINSIDWIHAGKWLGQRPGADLMVHNARLFTGNRS